MNPGEKIINVDLTEDELKVELLHATPEQRAKWVIAGDEYGIHRPDVDEDLSSEGLLRGAPAPRRSVRA